VKYKNNFEYGSAILPERYVGLKDDILKEYKREDIEKAWGEVLETLALRTKESEKIGSAVRALSPSSRVDVLIEDHRSFLRSSLRIWTTSLLTVLLRSSAEDVSLFKISYPMRRLFSGNRS
jgi:hypothetical protein